MNFRPELIALLTDTGCLVLIWLVQLVVYPAFQYLDSDHLQKWHGTYTKNVSFVVLPLMLGQLVSSFILVLNNFTWLTGIKLMLVLSTWLLTFLVFVPLHNELDKGLELESNTKKLVQKNWTRTFAWSAIFMVQILYTLNNMGY